MYCPYCLSKNFEWDINQYYCFECNHATGKEKVLKTQKEVRIVRSYLCKVLNWSNPSIIDDILLDLVKNFKDLVKAVTLAEKGKGYIKWNPLNEWQWIGEETLTHEWNLHESEQLRIAKVKEEKLIPINLKPPEDFIRKIQEIFTLSRPSALDEKLFFVSEVTAHKETVYCWEFTCLNNIYEFLKELTQSLYKHHFRKIYSQFTNLYDCIVKGYYSFDDSSWLKSLCYFLDANYIIMNNLLNLWGDDHDPFTTKEQYFRFCEDNKYFHHFKIVHDALELHGELTAANGIVKRYPEFTLNFDKVIREQAIRYGFFKKHLEEFYSEEKQKILQERFEQESIDYEGPMKRDAYIYKEMNIHLKRVIRGNYDSKNILDKIKITPARQYDTYFSFLDGGDVDYLFQEAFYQKNYLILIKLLSEKPTLYKKLDVSQKVGILSGALSSNHPLIVSMVISDGHLNNLDNKVVNKMIDNPSIYNLSKDTLDKLIEWDLWSSKGYPQFRGEYIHEDDVKILVELEQEFNIQFMKPKRISTPPHQFMLNEDRRVYKVSIGMRIDNPSSQIIKNRNLLFEIIHQFKYLKKKSLG